MANVIVEESSLSAIADAIRTKNGLTDTYKPAEMSDAVEALNTGGITPTGTISIISNDTYDVTNYASAEVNVPTGTTPTGTKSISITANGTTTEDVTEYASAEITVNVPSATLGTKTITANGTYTASSDSLDGYSSVTVNVSGGSGTDYLAEICNGTITRLDDDDITNVKAALFRGYNASSLVVFLKNCTTLTNGYCFGGSGITSVVLPALEKVTSAGFFFSGASNMTALDIGSSFSTESYGIRGNAFNGASALTTLILRKTSGIVPLQGVNAFNNTPFKSGGAGGTIYVPSSLISTYQSATNWSTMDGYGTITWTAIEGSQYENYYADGTAIS